MENIKKFGPSEVTLTMIPSAENKISKKTQVLSEALEKRWKPGTIVVKSIDVVSGSLDLLVMNEWKNFFLRMDQLFPSGVSRASKWEGGQNVFDIDVDVDPRNLTKVTKRVLDPTKIQSKQQLHRGATDLLKRYNDESCDEVKIEKLKKSFSKLTVAICGKEKDIYISGSRSTGLATSDSDVDIYIDTDGSFDGSISHNIDEQKKRVESFAMKMDSGSDFNVVRKILDTSVPILKFEHKDTKLKGDLSFRSGMSTKNSELVKLYLDLDLRVKYVVAGVKFWMELHELADKNIFPSYTQIWFALFFLMQVGVIPSLEKLRKITKTSSKQPTIEGWCSAIPTLEKAKLLWKTKCVMTKEQLLEQFFVYYSEIRLAKFLLCTFTGQVMRKKGYFQKFRKTFFKWYLEEKGPEAYAIMRQKIFDDCTGFRLFDPIDQLKNLTKNMPKENCHKFSEFIVWCRKTAINLKS